MIRFSVVCYAATQTVITILFYCRLYRHNTFFLPFTMKQESLRVCIHYMFRPHRPSSDIFTNAYAKQQNKKQKCFVFV
jgi:hypothetical protein